MQPPDDVDGVTVLRGPGESKNVLTLDPQGMRMTHSLRSFAFDVAWAEVEDVKVVNYVTAKASEASVTQPFAAFRRKQSNPGFLARLKRGLKDWDEVVLATFDPPKSPEELADLIERYRLRHTGPE